MKIHLNTLTGRHLEVNVAENECVYRLKELFHEREEIPLDQFYLVFAGKRLEDDKTLDRYSIQANSTIHVILRLRTTGVERRTPLQPENPYPSFIQAERIIEEWNFLAKNEGFDADTHIVEPEAHYIAMESLERTVAIQSELYRRSGSLSAIPKPDITVISLFNIKAPDWIHHLLLDAAGGREVIDNEAVIDLCESYIILQSLIERFDDLVARNFCQEFFSILLLKESKDIAEIIKIPRTTLGSLAATLFTALANARYVDRDVIAETVKPAAEGFLDLIGHASLSSDPLETCRVIAYLLDIGLVTYVGSHGSRFDREYFGTDLSPLHYTKDERFGFECNLRTLACLNGFLDAREVWVFEVKNGKPPPGSERSVTQQRLSILTTIDALSDIWGPIYAEAVHQESSAEKAYRVKRYNVSKGCIRRVPDKSSSSNQYVKCHWYSRAEEQRRRFSTIFSGRSENLTMSLDDKLLIGTEMTVKPDCTFSLTDYEMNFGDAIFGAGPKPSTWMFDGMEVSLELTAPKVVMFQIKGKAKRIPETTIKEHAWQKWSTSPESANPGILNKYFGVEISNCTGNARRVSLKYILLMHPMQELLERQIPGWKLTRWGMDFLKALQTESDNAVFDFWRNHVAERSLVGRLISSVLDVLDGTGASQLGLRAAFLHQNHENTVTIDIKDNDWAGLLKDSYLMATYAVVNEICLEYKLPDHSTSICNDERRYSVLQTKIGTQLGDTLHNRFKIDPNGLTVKNLGPDFAPSPYLLVRDTSLRAVISLGTRWTRAKELSDQQCHDRQKHHKVFLRATQKSFGGMSYQRQRDLTKADECPMDMVVDYQTMNLDDTQEALSQSEIEALIRADQHREVVEDDQKARC